jgi:fucose permease
MQRHNRPAVLLAFAAFVLFGINIGDNGVLLLAQMSDYGIDRAVIGITFFTGAAGFVLGSLHSGVLVHRAGLRLAMVTGGGAFVAGSLYLATRPPLAVLLVIPLVTGYASGVVESALSAYCAAQDDATTLVNRLHAFFGVGALIGPALAAWIVGLTAWTVVVLVLGLAAVPLVAGFALVYPGTPGHQGAPRRPGAAQSPGAAEPGPSSGRLLSAALRDRGVLAGAAMLAVYVGVEFGVGNWAFSYLVQARGLSQSLAGYAVSGLWLGLTVGRFVISPVAARLGMSTSALMYSCLTGIAAATTFTWLAPTPVTAGATLVLLGFFLGPVFPTTMSVAPRLTQPRLASTAIGVMNAGSSVGGSALPWLAGAVTQSTGIKFLFPFILVLAAVQFATLAPIAARIRHGQPAHAAGVERAALPEVPPALRVERAGKAGAAIRRTRYFAGDHVRKVRHWSSCVPGGFSRGCLFPDHAPPGRAGQRACRNWMT